MSVNKTATAIFVVIVAVLAGFELMPRTELPSHLLNHPVVFTPELLTEEQAEGARKLMHRFGDLPSNTQDVRFYTTLHEHIGEAQPMNAEGGCDHPYLVPNNQHTQCILPGRIDIGRHFIKAGGLVGLKESYDSAVSRLLSFGRYMFDPNAHPEISGLFDSPNFQQAAKSVCPDDKQYLDAFQYNFIVQVPGQTVALHIDAPYFWGASRFQYPQWLLAAMVFSGKFQEQFVDQVQVVAYLHKWNDTEGVRDGTFAYWDKNTRYPEVVPPTPRAGSMVDGSKTVHAAGVYRPKESPPKMDKSVDNRLIHNKGTDTWSLTANGTEVRKYDFDDLRISLVYRARCFHDRAEYLKYNSTKDTELIPLDTILRTLAADMVDRGVVSSVEEAMSMERIDLALLILDTFIKYPLSPTALVPFNYCAMGRLVPATNLLLQHFC